MNLEDYFDRIAVLERQVGRMSRTINTLQAKLADALEKAK